MAELVFQNPRFDALRSALYHTERHRFLDLLNRSINFVVVLLGARAAAKGVDAIRISGVWVELGIVVFSTPQPVFDFGGVARVHEFLQRRYYDILEEIEVSKSESNEVMRKWSGKLIALTSDEPMTM